MGNCCLVIYHRKRILHALVVNDAQENLEKIVEIATMFFKTEFHKEVCKHCCRLLPKKNISINPDTVCAEFSAQCAGLISAAEVADDEQYNVFPRDRQMVIDGITASLHEERDFLSDIVKRTQGEIINLPTASDEVDVGSIHALRMENARTNKRTREKIASIDEALRRIDIGTYGVCVTCDEEIDIYRLISKRTSPLCIDCQTLAERG